jgi:hypothetical protein
VQILRCAQDDKSSAGGAIVILSEAKDLHHRRRAQECAGYERIRHGFLFLSGS